MSRTIWNLAIREMSKAYHTDLPLERDYISSNSEIDLPMEFYFPPGLPDGYREIILMRLEREMTYAEIAAEKGLSEEAARQQVSRAIRKCRQLMQESEDGAPV